MKKIALIFSLISLILISCGGNKEKQEEQTDKQQEQENVVVHEKKDARKNIIGEQHIGEIEIGMEIEKLKEQFPEEQIKSTTKSMEGEDYTIYHVFFGENDVISMEVEPISTDKGEIISRMMLYDNTPKTKEGIGVGNTIAELREAYNIKSYYVSAIDGDIFAAVEEYESVVFAIDQDELMLPPETVINKEKINDKWLIKYVYIF
jgi:hypothetical protein